MSFDSLLEDIENVLSQHNIILTSEELRVVKKKKLVSGFLQQTVTERHALEQIKTNPVPGAVREVILDSLCLTVEDIKKIQTENSHCKLFNLKFRRVLIYGNAVIENNFTRDGDNMYTISIDDETGVISGTYKEFDKKLATKQKAIFTREENQLKRRRETGINVNGRFYPPESEESQYVFSSVSNLQQMIQKNLHQLHRKYQQGPLKQKVLMHAKPFKFHNTIRLYIIDFWENDKMELSWKRNLSKFYRNFYLK